MKYSFLLSILLLINWDLISQNQLEAKIVSSSKDNLVNVGAIATNLNETYEEGFDYLLLWLKEDAKGKLSREVKSGEFAIGPKEEKLLDGFKFSIQNSESFKIYFFLRKDEKLISKDSLFIVSNLKKSDVIDEADIEIYGLITDDVVTKLGKDFYDYLYQYYLNSGAKYPFIINVIEKPNFGRSSMVSILIDDQIIYQFNTQPKDEFLVQMAKQSLRYIQNYANRRKFIFKNKKI